MNRSPESDDRTIMRLIHERDETRKDAAEIRSQLAAVTDENTQLRYERDQGTGQLDNLRQQLDAVREESEQFELERNEARELTARRVAERDGFARLLTDADRLAADRLAEVADVRERAAFYEKERDSWRATAEEQRTELADLKALLSEVLSEFRQTASPDGDPTGIAWEARDIDPVTFDRWRDAATAEATAAAHIFTVNLSGSGDAVTDYVVLASALEEYASMKRDRVVDDDGQLVFADRAEQLLAAVEAANDGRPGQ